MRFSSFFPARTVCRTALAAAVAVGGLATGLQAQAATDDATISATVVTPIAIVNTAGLNFGSFSSATAGTVVVAPNGTRTQTGGVLLVNSVNSPAAASFNVTGEGTLTYAITLPGSAVTINGPSSSTMSVATFTSNPSGTGTLTAGAQTLTVGATLTTGVSQTTGAYSGTFDVTVEYN